MEPKTKYYLCPCCSALVKPSERKSFVCDYVCPHCNEELTSKHLRYE
jgi:Zn-finger nucleic acid-binding protein